MCLHATIREMFELMSEMFSHSSAVQKGTEILQNIRELWK